MAGFDQSLRRETWCYQRTPITNSLGKPCIQLLPFKFVEYDGDPNRYLEPHNWAPFFHACLGSAAPANMWNPINPVADGTTITGIEIFDSPSVLWEGVHEFHFM